MRGCPSGHPPSFLSFYELIDGLAQVVYGGGVPCCHRIYDAVPHMVLEDHLACAVQCGANGCQLDQDFGAVMPLLYHSLDLFQVADGAGQPIEHCFLIFMDMAVSVGGS